MCVLVLENWQAYRQGGNLLPDTSSYDRRRRVFSEFQRNQDGLSPMPEARSVAFSEYKTTEEEDDQYYDEDDEMEQYKLTPKDRRQKRRPNPSRSNAPRAESRNSYYE